MQLRLARLLLQMSYRILMIILLVLLLLTKCKVIVLTKTVLRETTVRSIAIVYDENNASFARIIKENFEVQMKDSGASVVATASFKNRSDFKNIISEVRESKAEGILLIASAIDAGMFCQQSRKQNLQIASLFADVDDD